MRNLESGLEGLFEINPALVLQARPKDSLLLGKIFKEMSFGWWPVRFFFFFFFSSLGIDRVTDLQWLEWVLALIPPLSPVEHCEVREMSASCFLPGTCSPSLSCAFLCQSHLCLSHLAWQYYPISPVSRAPPLCFSLSPPLFQSPLPVVMHCWTNFTLLAIHSHIMVPPAASLTLWSDRCLCQSMCSFDVGISRTHCYFFPPLYLLFLSQEWGSTHPFLSLTWLTT